MKICGTMLLFCFTFFGHSQNNTLQYVPADAPFVLSLNLGNLSKRVNLNNLKQYDFYKAMLKEMENAEIEDDEEKYFRRFLDSPAELGFEMLRPFYFFVKEKDDTTFYTMVMEMGNRALYENGLMELFPEKYETNLSEKNGYQMWQGDNDTYVWNDEVILNIWSQYTPSFNNDWNEYPPVTYDSLIYDEEGEYTDVPPPPPVDEDIRMEESDVMEPDTLPFNENELGLNIWETDTKMAAANWADAIMTKRNGASLSANPKYQSAKAQSADLHFWMDYNYFLNEFQESQALLSGMADDAMAAFANMASGFIGQLYSDSYLSVGLSFEQGKMALRSQQFFNPKLQDFYAGVNRVKFNKKFFRHIAGGEDLFGYAYFNFNVKNAIEEGKPLLHDLLRSQPKYGEAASDLVKIFGIFIDEDAIGNLFKGDMLMAFSGMQTMEVNEKIYDFDEDFNYVEKDTIVQKTFPNVTALATFGSRSDIQKFIDLGLHTETIQKEGNLFTIAEPTSGLSFYLALHKNMLILSNNREQLTSSVEKGLSKQNRLSKKHRKLLCENASVMYWDVPNTMRQTATNDGSTNFGPMYYVDVFGKQFDSFSWKSSKKVEGSLNNEFNFNFKNKGTNSLEQFFIFINDIYLEFQGGAKI